jgi:ribosomal protein S18 acetylase RimI-like enzyme
MTGQTFEIRRSTASDADLLFRLFAENKGDEFAVLDLSQELLGSLVQAQYQARCRSYAAEFPLAEQFILIDDDADVGQMLISQQGDSLLLVDMAVKCDNRNRGVGTAALQWLLNLAAIEGRNVTLSVRVGSPAARLYSRIGFHVTGDSSAEQTMCWMASREALHAA